MDDPMMLIFIAAPPIAVIYFFARRIRKQSGRKRIVLIATGAIASIATILISSALFLWLYEVIWL